MLMRCFAIITQPFDEGHSPIKALTSCNEVGRRKEGGGGGGGFQSLSVLITSFSFCKQEQIYALDVLCYMGACFLPT